MLAFLHEVRENLEDLMSLNTINPEEQRGRPPVKGDSRSLRTDDIEGAKPKSGMRRQPETNAYQGLSLPSYADRQLPNKRGPPANASDDYIASAAKFFGTTPPGSPRNFVTQKPPAQASYSSYSPQPGSYNQKPTYDQNFNPKAAANFYGVTPPMSGYQGDPYAQRGNPSAKEIANFYGVTPPQSRSQNLMQPAYSKPNPPAKDIANFYGVTPPQSRSQNLAPSNQYARVPQEEAIPPRNVANFYGVTPPQSRAPNAYDYQNKGGYNESPAVPIKAAAGFYGATPPQSRAVNNIYGQDLGNYAKPPLRNSNIARENNQRNPITQSPVNYKSEIPPKAAAGFYGSTPPVSRQAYEVPQKVSANFYGVTPPATGQNYGQNNGGDFMKNAGKFFGDDGVDPEFQLAADIVNKGGYQGAGKAYGNPRYQGVSTASRIFN